MRDDARVRAVGNERYIPTGAELPVFSFFILLFFFTVRHQFITNYLSRY